MNIKIEKATANELKLDYIELKSTDDGYPLYQSLGFREMETRYRSMKLVRDLFVNI